MKQLLAGASLLPILAAGGLAHAADAAAATGSGAAVSELIVTGTRQTGLKAADSAAPIQILGSDALRRIGPPDLIQSLAQNLPSFNAEGYGADTAALTLSAQLRGLNPNNTLVLVNGKRRHTTGNLHVDPGVFQGAATADLSLIPVAAIDHIEVLQDGAAAQYGSDAIAGVVNIILKNNAHGGIASATGGQYYEGDGDTGAASVNLGLPLAQRGFFNVTGEFRYHDFSQQGGADRRLFNLDGSLKPVGTLPGEISPVNAAGVQGVRGYPRVNPIYGDTLSNLYDATYNSEYDIGGGIQFYSFGSYAYRKASAYENYRVPNRVSGTDAQGSPVYPFPHGFNPREALREYDYSITGGFKGAVDGWNWDLSTTYGRDKDEISTINSANASLFKDTGFTPTNFYDGAFIASEWTNNLDIDKSVPVGLATPLNIGFGGEIRRETFTIDRGDAASIYKEGGQSYPGFQPSDAASHNRTNYAGYVDLAVDPITNLHVDLAGRYEDYTDFGSTAVGKLTARYDFTPRFAIRGTIANGFRAPTLQEEYYSATNVAPTFAVVNLPPNSAAAHLVGFQNLKPENSYNYSFGFVAHPVDKLQFTADFYEIDIHDRIVATGTLLGLSGHTIVSQNVLDAIAAHGNVLDPSVTYVGISVFTNGVNTRNRGVEVTATYASDFGDLGHVDWSAAFNYNIIAITNQAPLPAQVTNVAFGQTTILGPTALSTLTSGSPQYKFVLGANYNIGKFGVSVSESIYGPVSEILSTSGTGVGGLNVSMGVTGITNLDLSYAITPDLKFDIGANNLFNHRPPTVPNIPDGSGGVRPVDGNNVYYEPIQFSPYGINGGYYYGRLTFRF